MSEMLGISTKTAYKLLKEDKIEHFMIGRIYKIPKYHILQYLNLLGQNKLIAQQVMQNLCHRGIIFTPIADKIWLLPHKRRLDLLW